MKSQIRTPFFEIGVKNYLFGDDVLKLAKAADRAAKEYDVDVLFISPYTEIRRISEETDLIVFAPYMDLLKPGRGMADVLPEAIKAAGAKGVVINHCERPLTLSAVQRTIERASELDLLSFVCSDTIQAGESFAHFHPDILNPEPTELIGSGNVSDISFVKASNDSIHRIYPDILIEQAAGVSTPKHVYDLICSGAQGVGVASGICCSDDPCKTATEMIKAVRDAINYIMKKR